MSTGSIKSRRAFADYINVAATTGAEADYAFMGTGFKTLDESPAAQTKSRKYVCDKSATKSITSYDWSVAYELDQIREQEAVDFICNIGERQLIGADAETDYIRVDMLQAVSGSEGTYEARKFRVAVEVAAFGNDDGDMGGSGNLLGIGDPIFGKFNTTTRTFTAEGEVTT